MKRVKRGACIGIGLLLAGGVALCAGNGARADDPTQPPTTSTPKPVSGDGSLTTGSSNGQVTEKKSSVPHVTYSVDKPNVEAIKEFARQNNVSASVAIDQLNQMGEMTARADKMSLLPEFSGFQIAHKPDGLEGQIALTSSDVVPGNVDPVSGFRVVHSAVSRADVPKVSNEMTTLAIDAGISDAVSVLYDPFGATVVLWKRNLSSTSDSEPIDQAADARDAALLQKVIGSSQLDLAGLPVVVGHAGSDVRNGYGGQPLTQPASFLFWNWNSNECTSSFELYYPGHTGHLTAGHCTGGGWNAAGNPIITYWDSLHAGGYVDRLVMEDGTYSSYWTYTGTAFEDMDSSMPASHIYAGTWYCEWARHAYGQQCGYPAGTPTPYNKVIYDPATGQTYYATQGSANQKCSPGDSGGPVWQPIASAPSKPAGMVEGGGSSDQCFFSSLNDQFSGMYWVLL